jgi:hypothetical protein
VQSPLALHPCHAPAHIDDEKAGKSGDDSDRLKSTVAHFLDVLSKGLDLAREEHVRNSLNNEHQAQYTQEVVHRCGLITKLACVRQSCIDLQYSSFNK